MKWIVLLVLFAVITLIAFTRYRKQIIAAGVLWRSLTNPDSARRSDRPQFDSDQNAKSVELIKCEACGSWTPELNSLRLNSGEKFCSPDCIAEAVAVKKKNAI